MIINAHGIEYLIIFKFHFDCIEALFFNKKINRSRLYPINKEKQQEGFVQVLLRRLHCHLRWILEKNIFLHKLAHVLMSLFWEKSGCPVFNIYSNVRGWIL